MTVGAFETDPDLKRLRQWARGDAPFNKATRGYLIRWASEAITLLDKANDQLRAELETSRAERTQLHADLARARRRWWHVITVPVTTYMRAVWGGVR